MPTPWADPDRVSAAQEAPAGAEGAAVRVVPARVGLVGNPSDGYGGAVLATVVPGLAATVTASVAAEVTFDGPDVAVGWISMSDWLDDVRSNGHGGEERRIISAACWTLAEHLESRRHARPGAGTIGSGVALRWQTDVPRSVGLAGSSALAVAVIDSVAEVWGHHLDRRVVAALALRAERDVLGLAAGWQDRIVQSFGRTVLVDASSMEVIDGIEVPRVVEPGRHERSSLDHGGQVDQGDLVDLVVAWSSDAPETSDSYHAPLRRRAEELAAPMAELAALARRAAEAWRQGDVAALASAVDAGWRCRQSCAPLRSDHAAIVELARDAGLHATTPGSGGSVVAISVDAETTRQAVETLRRAGLSTWCVTAD